jgi:hypothetical protein
MSKRELILLGTPAIDHRIISGLRYVQRLPELKTKIDELEKQIELLKKDKLPDH